MDDVPVRVNGPVSGPRHAGGSPSSSGRGGKLKKNKLKLGAIIAGVAVAVVLLFAGGWWLVKSSTAAAIDTNKYQAVFLSSGQVYFGKLQQINSGYFKLTDVFYIQAKDANSKNPQETGDQQASDLQLIKLGDEVHGPDDEMIVSKDQVLFFENLKKDGKVTSSIVKYNETEKK